MNERRLHAYIDESGIRSNGSGASDYFILAAVVFRESYAERAHELLEEMRAATGRQSGQLLHWNQVRDHEKRVTLAGALSDHPWLKVSSVVVCKRQLTAGLPSVHHAYLFTLRFLLERLSWLAPSYGRQLSYTLAHIQGFTKWRLRDYESRLRLDPDCTLDWTVMNSSGGALSSPTALEFLQLADVAASAIGKAFETNYSEPPRQDYIHALAPALYRGAPGPASLTSYGLKMHPWTETTKAAHPWVAAL